MPMMYRFIIPVSRGLIEDALFRINEGLNRILNWASKNSLRLNAAKSTFIAFSQDPVNLFDFSEIMRGNTALSYVSKVRNLRIIFDCSQS